MILKGDCIEIMKALKLNSVDAIVCDPPYGLEFMGKKWDKLWDKRRKTDERTFGSNKCGIRNNPQYKAGLEAQLWHTQWLTEAYRALKPGGSMLVMGGTRTFHRLACAIEDSGFIIKDTLMWLYGSGFPKAQDLGKMIDKRAKAKRKIIGHYIAPDGIFRDCKNHKPNEEIRNPETHYGYKTSGYRPIDAPNTDLAKHWDGFKVGGIKPAYEPIVWAVKPPEGSYVDNVLKHGVGAVNVDECRINHAGQDGVYGSSNKSCKPTFCDSETVHNFKSEKHTKGRFPANVILDEEAGRLLDEQSGNLQSGDNPKRRGSAVFKNCYGEFQGQEDCSNHYSRGADSGGASRFFYCAKASRSERNRGLEGMEERDLHWSSGHKNPGSFQSDGIKKKATNAHPTVKPIKLFEWLVRLVTREGQIVLDPFLGSGTTAIAAHNAGRKCVGIEKEEEYLGIAKKRIDYWEGQPKQMELR